MSVLSTSNNTIITLTDMEGRVQAWASGGTLGFTNARKSTSHAAEAVAAHMGEKARGRLLSCVAGLLCHAGDVATCSCMQGWFWEQHEGLTGR